MFGIQDSMADLLASFRYNKEETDCTVISAH